MSNTRLFAETLGTAVKSALIEGGAARQALLDARAALDAGDMKRVALIITNRTPDGTEGKLTDVEDLLYESIPRDGEPQSY